MATTTAERRVPSGMTPEQGLAWLDSEEACEALSKSARKKIRRTIRQKLRRSEAVRAATCVALYVHCCSAWWAELIYVELAARSLIADSAAHNAASAFGKGIYPPVTERPGCGMRRCVECGAWHPPANVSTDSRGGNPICDDCGSGTTDYTMRRERSVLASNEDAKAYWAQGLTFQRKR